MTSVKNTPFRGGSPVSRADSTGGIGHGPATAPTAASRGTPAAARAPEADPQVQQLRKLLNGHTDRNEEKQIIELFRGLTPPQLNAVIGQLSLREIHEMVGDVQNHSFVGIQLGPKNQDALLGVLSRERLNDLSLESRAKVIHGLQRHATHPNSERAIRDIFLGTRGGDLSELKRRVDGGGDYHDLQQLLWHDIDSRQTRDQILQHFQKEAIPTGQVKVLSDIDDTFYRNLKDDRYPSKTVYPGVRALYRELDRGPNADQPDATGDVTFISARPYDRAGRVEDELTRTMLRGNDVEATIRSGDFLHVVGNHAIADKKFANWQQERLMYPEYRRVAFGDSGQGDMYLEEKALQTGQDTAAAFLHNVTHLSDADRARYQSEGITVIDTYLGAANEAFRRGLISRDGLQRVANSALTELAEIKFDSPEQKAARQAELNRDLAAMRQILGTP